MTACCDLFVFETWPPSLSQAEPLPTPLRLLQLCQTTSALCTTSWATRSTAPHTQACAPAPRVRCAHYAVAFACSCSACSITTLLLLATHVGSAKPHRLLCAPPGTPASSACCRCTAESLVWAGGGPARRRHWHARGHPPGVVHPQVRQRLPLLVWLLLLLLGGLEAGEILCQAPARARIGLAACCTTAHVLRFAGAPNDQHPPGATGHCCCCREVIQDFGPVPYGMQLSQS